MNTHQPDPSKIKTPAQAPTDEPASQLQASEPDSLPTLIPLTTGQARVVTRMYAEVEKDEQSSREWDRKRKASDRLFIAAREANLQSLLPESRSELHHDAIDSLVQKALSVNKNGEFNQMLIAACDAFRRCPSYDYMGWSHAVCHNFEKFNRKHPDSSLLGHPEIAAAVEGLIEEATARAVENGNGCFERTMGGIIGFALSQVEMDKVEEPFPWKPACLSDARVASLLGENSARGSVRGIFCLSKTPREFVEGVAKLVATSEKEIYGVNLALDLLEAVRNENNCEIIDACIFKQHRLNHADIPADKVGQLLEDRRAAATAEETLPGIFVDVDNTLVALDWETKMPKLSDVAKVLWTLAPGSRKQITIFTGGDPEKATERLKGLGFPSDLLPVRSKSEFRGKRLAVLIDDTPADIQGFSAENAIDPNHGFNEAFIKLDPLEAIARFKRDKELAAVTEPIKQEPPQAREETGAKPIGQEPPLAKKEPDAPLAAPTSGLLGWLKGLFS